MRNNEIKQSSKDKIISTVMKFNKDGWPATKHDDTTVELFRKL